MKRIRREIVIQIVARGLTFLAGIIQTVISTVFPMVPKNWEPLFPIEFLENFVRMGLSPAPKISLKLICAMSMGMVFQMRWTRTATAIHFQITKKTVPSFLSSPALLIFITGTQWGIFLSIVTIFNTGLFVVFSLRTKG